MEIKQSHWFAAGPEVEAALKLLSDGAFRLYFHICLVASRSTGRIHANYADLACALGRSRRSIATYLEEMRERGVCRINPAVNQHGCTEIEICDEFWSYTKERTAIPPSEWENFRTQIKSLLSKRACVQCEFAATDERFAAELFARRVSLEEVERAIALACCRKYAGLINGTDNEPIRRLSYFRDSIEEVRDPDAPPIQAQLLSQRIQTVQYLEEKWLLMQNRTADARNASANRQRP